MSGLINTLIFSKDRAAQLDLFLRSLKVFYPSLILSEKINVLYTHSTEAFKAAYAITRNHHPEINFVLEKNFKQDVIDLTSSEKLYSVFFVDDNVFKNSFSIDCTEFDTFKDSDNIACLSLRLCPRITYCYPMDIAINVPEFIKEQYIWGWDASIEGCWSYPMSLDGHFFKTKDIYSLLLSLPYYNPNLLEGLLTLNPIRKPNMICFKDSKVINIPANKVQTLNDNKHGKISALHINENYLKGKRLSLYKLFTINKFVENTACHEEVNLCWD